MSKQTYKNHKRYYIPHHFIFLPLVTAACVLAFYKVWKADTDKLSWLLFAIACFFILYLALMLRQHYALGNQDRIIRLEFRLRYFQLYGKPADDIEKRLSFGQVAALRFADDEAFKVLLDRALTEGLSPDEIKRSITAWQADNMRV